MYARFKIWWRATAFPTPPATVIGLDGPGQKTKGDPLTLSTHHENAVRARNTEKAGRYIFKARSGWMNNFNAAGRPVVEKIGFGGNVAKVLERVPGHLLLDTLALSAPIPPAEDHLHWHRFTCVDLLGRVRQPGDGFDAWVLFVSDGPFWVQEKNVELFENEPQPIWPGGLPSDLAGYAAEVVRDAVLRQTPEGNKAGFAPAGTIVRVISEIRGWAKIGEKRWVELGRIRKI